jgi:hypothetical protein
VLPRYLPREFFYECLKDVRTYALVLAIVLLYRLILLRLQGEARLLQAPDAGPPVESVDRPERFLVRKLGGVPATRRRDRIAAGDGQLREPARARPRLSVTQHDGRDQGAARPRPLRARAPQLHRESRLHRGDRAY